jgi:hypothetical protein
MVTIEPKGYTMRTCNITDWKLKGEGLAKVIISYTGDVDAQYIKETLIKKLQGSAAPVMSSFKEVKKGVAVGFIKANKAVIPVTDKQITANYRQMGENVLLDKSDNSLWQVKTSTATNSKYLTRHEQEDLTALVAAAAQPRSDVPRLSHITIARAAAKELVAFVDQEGDVDYGFALKAGTEKVRVLSFNRRVEATVDYDSVVSISPIQIPRELHQQVVASMTAAEKTNAKAYWEKLYYWAPEYLRQLKDFVDEGTVA